MRAGSLNRRALIQRRSDALDGAGQPVDTWEDVGQCWAGIANETGLGAIRSGLIGGVPSSIARYSFMVRFEDIARLGIAADMRLVHDGLVFDVKGVTRDIKSRDKAFILTEQGGNAG